MVAAHKGVPVAQLPGGWTSGTGGIVPPDPLTGEEDPVASLPDDAVPSDPARSVGTAAPAQEETASINRPVPPADVGGKKVKRQTSLLDVLLGAGQ
jgi:penicillin-binding protein 1A